MHLTEADLEVQENSNKKWAFAKCAAAHFFCSPCGVRRLGYESKKKENEKSLSKSSLFTEGETI